MNFKQALDTGKVVLRRVWLNENSKYGNWTFQFFQKIEKPQEGNSGLLLSISLGIEGYNSNIVSDLLTFSPKKAEEMGISIGDYYKDDQEAIFADDIFGVPTGIQVVDNTYKNSKRPSQTPRMNPTTNEYLVDAHGRPIFRHTQILPGAKQLVTLCPSAGTIPQSVYESKLTAGEVIQKEIGEMVADVVGEPM